MFFKKKGVWLNELYINYIENHEILIITKNKPKISFVKNKLFIKNTLMKKMEEVSQIKNVFGGHCSFLTMTLIEFVKNYVILNQEVILGCFYKKLWISNIKHFLIFLNMVKKDRLYFFVLSLKRVIFKVFNLIFIYFFFFKFLLNLNANNKSIM